MWFTAPAMLNDAGELTLLRLVRYQDAAGSLSRHASSSVQNAVIRLQCETISHVDIATVLRLLLVVEVLFLRDYCVLFV